AVLAALQQKGYEVEAVELNQNSLEKLAILSAEMVFIALHGRGGEDGTVQAVLDLAGKKYTGSGVLASALAMDKLRSKFVWKGMGLPTPDFVLLNQETDWQQVFETLGGDVIVKPANEGSSIGMSRVRDAEGLKKAYLLAAGFDSSVLAESWIEGGEYTVAILNGEALPVIRLETDNDFYDYQAKYESDQTRYLCPCGLSPEEERKMQLLALEAFNSLGCKGWGRVDVMRDSKDANYLLEVNTVPGMTSHSLVPMAAKSKGMTFPDLVVAIVEERS
ncbi:MAG: D-alanine--D-alanine ligase, partial [Pseudomonadales bacterium]|nr:D-alanine--D-alanine ligase [Pseudomonadales bacterium]